MLAANLFSLVVFVCDGFLEERVTLENSHWVRFLAIARKLPLELQMVLCNRTFGEAGSVVSIKDSELSFRRFGRLFAQEEAKAATQLQDGGPEGGLSCVVQ